MNSNRNGKIACLPETVRNELNRRLHDGERGQPLIAWLNDLPDVRQIMKKLFHGKPITAANLSHWRNGGYRDWRLEHEPKPPPRPEWEARQRPRQPQPCQLQQAQHQHSPQPSAPPAAAHAQYTDDSNEVTDPAEVSDRLAVRLGLELTQFAESWLAEATRPRERWRRLRELLAALAQLRRGDHRAANLDMAQDRWQAEVDEREAALEQKSAKAIKEAALSPMRAARQLPQMAELYGGGEAGWKLAARLLETQFDLAPETLLKPGCEPWRKGWTPGQKPKNKAQAHAQKKKSQTRNPRTRRQPRKAIPAQPEIQEIEPNDHADSSQNPGDSGPIQTDPGAF